MNKLFDLEKSKQEWEALKKEFAKIDSDAHDALSRADSSYHGEQFADHLVYSFYLQKMNYKKCGYCRGTKVLCSSAGVCDHDGKSCNENNNCGEFAPTQCKHCY